MLSVLSGRRDLQKLDLVEVLSALNIGRLQEMGRLSPPESVTGF